MKLLLTIVAGALLAGTALAGDIYVLKDANGNLVYTDTPQTVPAQRVGIRSGQTDPSEVQARYSDEMKQYAAQDEAANKQAQQASATKANALSAEDRARRCDEARKRYDTVMFNYRLYEVGPAGERRYLDSAEIDAARADAKKVMDEFCGAQ
jgi:hypothetical protein